MEIRPCSAADLERLRQAWPSGGDVHSAFAADQDAGAADYLVAWDADVPLGSALLVWTGAFGPNARTAFPDRVAISQLQVRPEHRGRGVGTALVRDAEQRALLRGSAQITIAVGLDNPDARRLYLRLGYTPTGVTDTYDYRWIDDTGVAHDETETAEVLVRDLPA